MSPHVLEHDAMEEPMYREMVLALSGEVSGNAAARPRPDIWTTDIWTRTGSGKLNWPPPFPQRGHDRMIWARQSAHLIYS